MGFVWILLCWCWENPCLFRVFSDMLFHWCLFNTTKFLKLQSSLHYLQSIALHISTSCQVFETIISPVDSYVLKLELSVYCQSGKAISVQRYISHKNREISILTFKHAKICRGRCY
jgi:hypothetical protein